MYIGLDVSVHFQFKENGMPIIGGRLIQSGKDVNEFRVFLENLRQEDFIAAQVEHLDDGEKYEFTIREDLIADTYRWLSKPPREHK